MKRIRTFLIAATLGLTAHAQGEIEALFGSIDSIGNQIVVEKENYEDLDIHPGTHCYYTRIAVPKSTFGRLGERFVQTFTNQPSAYRIYRKTLDGPSDIGTLTITYGTQQTDYKIPFGSRESHNYLVTLYKDSLNADKRHAYALVWYTESDKVNILRYHIYGDDPRQTNRQRVLTYDNGRLIYSNGNIITGIDQRDTLIHDDVDFLSRFGTLRASLLRTNQNETLIRNGMAIKMLDLCKKHHQLLSAGERETCVKSLTELIIDEQDTYIKGLLKAARTALERQ